MLRSFITTVAILTLAAGAVPAGAAPCKDAKGRFMKCPDKAKTSARCKDSKGKFAKCGTPGAKPA